MDRPSTWKVGSVDAARRSAVVEIGVIELVTLANALDAVLEGVRVDEEALPTQLGMGRADAIALSEAIESAVDRVDAGE